MGKKPKKNGIFDSDETKTREVADLETASSSGSSGCLIYVSAAGAGDRGRSVLLEGGEAVIGRGEECNLVLKDDSVSRRHVKLVSHKKGIIVEDLGSKNGTTYLGKQIDRATLKVGARLGVGNCCIDLLPLPGPGSVPISDRGSYGELVGASFPMRRLYALLEALEGSDVPVLIEGETGTGKDLVARALHQNGLRAGKPFMIIDCGNMPVRLMESELFGYRKGAFTGAVADRAGSFEAGAGGTVFLDEIGDLPLDLQPKLLRVLESNQVKRLGDVNYTAVDVRVIAATKRNLKADVAKGLFREDLFYRIAVVHLQMPPLRDRLEDVPLLVNHLVGQISGADSSRLAPETVESFMHHEWPGNVRELRNAVQRTVALGLADTGAPAQAGARPRSPAKAGYRQAREKLLRDFDRTYLTDLMARFKGNQSAAAKAAGISRSYLRELLKKHGLC